MIRDKRKEKGLTQSKLAEILGKSAGYVNKLENSKFTNPTIKVILKLSEELDTCPIEIFLFFFGVSCKFRNECCKNFDCSEQ